MAEHDVVVIGAGHNGLIVACYLAKAGLDVCGGDDGLRWVVVSFTQIEIRSLIFERPFHGKQDKRSSVFDRYQPGYWRNA